jgi:NitT/TauT family transport system substrate-binding protein
MEPLVLGVNGSTRLHQAAMMVTLGKGYLEQQGFDVTLQVLPHTDLSPLVDGRLDATTEHAGIRLFQAWDPIRPIKLVADQGSWAEGRGQGFIVARQALLDSGELRDFSDLRGKRIALTSHDGDQEWLLFREALRRGSLTFDDVKVVHVDDRPPRMEGLATGAIDVAQEGTLQGLAYGRAHGSFAIWKRKHEVLAGRPYRVLVFSHEFWSQRPEAAQRCVLAFLQGLRDYYNAFERNVGRDEVIEILASQTGYAVDDLRSDFMIPELVDPDGYLNQAGFRANLRNYQEARLLDPSFTLEHVIDERYLQAALDELGTYQPLAAMPSREGP